MLVLGTAGYFLSQQGSNSSSIKNQNPAITSQPIQAADQTANWKIYKNTSYGFTLGYPDNWYVKERVEESSLLLLINPGPEPSQEPVMTHPAYTFYKIVIEVSKDKYTTQQLQRSGIEKDKDLEGKPYDRFRYEPITFLGLPANKKIGLTSGFVDNEAYTEIIFNAQDSQWSITYLNDDYEGNYNPLYDQIFTTFKFTDQQQAGQKIVTFVIQEGYSFEVTVPTGYAYINESVGDNIGYIADKNGEPFVNFLRSSGGGESSPIGETIIDGIPFTIDYRKNIGCNADLYPTKAKYPGANNLYFQISATRCKDEKERLAEISNKDMELIIQSIKFNSQLKNLLLGKTPAPLLKNK